MTATVQPTDRAATRKPRKTRTSIWQLEITPKKVKRRDLMHMSRQLAVFVRAGVPLVTAMEIISEETGDKLLRSILTDILERIRVGSTFSDALAVHAKAFPNYYLGIIASAELTGHLDNALVQLSDYIERDMEARRKVSGALIYPAIVAALAMLVVFVLTIYVLPKFETFFGTFNAKLPLVTRLLLTGSHTFRKLLPLWYALIALGIGVGVWSVRSGRGRRLRDRLVLRIPVVGDLVRHAVLERFCRILHSMVASGVPLSSAMVTVADATSNTVFQDALLRVRESMMRGEGLATPLADTGLFPSAAKQMFRVGEQTGSLDEQLEIAANFYASELDHHIKRFTSLFEPIVIATVGIIVGFVAIALVSAMYGIYHQVRV